MHRIVQMPEPGIKQINRWHPDCPLFVVVDEQGTETRVECLQYDERRLDVLMSRLRQKARRDGCPELPVRSLRTQGFCLLRTPLLAFSLSLQTY
jgi:hypothetical protein